MLDDNSQVWSEHLCTHQDYCGSGRQFLADLDLTLPFAEFQVYGTFLGQGRLPPFWGPTLRGAFGYHLKKTVCHANKGVCKSCIVRNTCAYSYIFEGLPPENREFMRLYPHIPQPFVLIADMGLDTSIHSGQPLQFGMRLFGKAIELFPYIVYSLLEIGKQGAGKDRIPFCINTITQPLCGRTLYEDGSTCLGTLEKENPPASNLVPEKNLVVEFVTPTKIQIDGKEAASIEFETLIKTALRRISILSYFYGTPLDPKFSLNELLEGMEKIEKVSEKTQIYEFSRFSGRQKKQVPLKGIVGKVVFAGNWACCRAILELAGIFNIGKATSFGFGRIQLSQE